MAKALTQVKILNKLRKLNPRDGFSLKVIYPGGHDSLYYPDSLEEAARTIAALQEKNTVSSIICGDFPTAPCRPDEHQVRVYCS